MNLSAELIKVALGAGLLIVIWLHGRHAGVESERIKLQASRGAAMELALERQAEIAKIMGQAMGATHERERLTQEQRDRLAAEAARLRKEMAQQIEHDSDCAQWAAAPIACRLRAPAAASGDDRATDVHRAARLMSADGSVGR